MRISSSWSQQLSINSMLDLQSQMSQTQLQLSSGKRLTAAADDPVAAAQVVDLNQNISQTEQFQKNIDVGKQRLSREGVILQSAIDTLNRIKDLGVQGLNSSNSPSDRVYIANEMKTLNNQLLGLSNSTDENGQYVFSGWKSNIRPFSEIAPGSGTYLYAGDTNQRNLQISTSRQVTDGDPGVNVFGTPSGAVPVAGSATNVFEAIDKFVADMNANTPNSASLGDLDASLNKMVTAQASVGARQNALDGQQQINSGAILGTQTLLSQTQDLDYASAISKFNLQTTTMQGAQQAYSKVKSLSLFNYL